LGASGSIATDGVITVAPPRTVTIALRNSAVVAVLSRYPFAPACRTFRTRSISAVAEKAMIFVSGKSRLIFWVASRPRKTGIWQSMSADDDDALGASNELLAQASTKDWVIIDHKQAHA
jgi:hypothetical protein